MLSAEGFKWKKCKFYIFVIVVVVFVVAAVEKDGPILI